MTIGNKIRALDYNNFRKRISAIYGSGGINPDTGVVDPKWGYGQTLQSADVDLNKKIGVSEWNKLIYDIANAWQQQNGTSITAPLSVVVSRGLTEGNKVRSNTVTINDIIAGNICVTEINHDLNPGDIFIPTVTRNGFISGTTYYIRTIPSTTQFTVSTTLGGAIQTLAAENDVNISGSTSSQPYNYLDSVLTNLSNVTNRFKAGTLVEFPPLGQNGSSPGGNPAVSFQQSATLSCDITFENSNEARWFFNSGGEIYFTSAFSPSLSNDQNTAWRDFLNTASLNPPKLRGNPSDTVNFYNLTETFKTLYEESNSSTAAYNAKLKWRIDVSTPGVTNNSNGTARIIRFSVIYEDQYVDPPVDPSSGFTPADFPPGDLVNGTLTLSARKRSSTFLKIPAGGGEFQVTGPINVVFTSILGV
jgi:hypothetical protein